jgi:hypothetical protein
MLDPHLEKNPKPKPNKQTGKKKKKVGSDLSARAPA